MLNALTSGLFSFLMGKVGTAVGVLRSQAIIRMNSNFPTDQKTIAIFTITQGYLESSLDQKVISPWRADLSFLQVIIIGSDIPLPRLACKGCSRLNLFTKLLTMQTDARLAFESFVSNYLLHHGHLSQEVGR